MRESTITDVEFITDDKETQISAVIDGVKVSIPKWPGNRHYDEIKSRVDAGRVIIGPRRRP